jgi:hypothetical protein
MKCGVSCTMYKVNDKSPDGSYYWLLLRVMKLHRITQKGRWSCMSFLSGRRCLHQEFIPENATVNKEGYKRFLPVYGMKCICKLSWNVGGQSYGSRARKRPDISVTSCVAIIHQGWSCDASLPICILPTLLHEILICFCRWRTNWRAVIWRLQQRFNWL